MDCRDSYELVAGSYNKCKPIYWLQYICIIETGIYALLIEIYYLGIQNYWLINSKYLPTREYYDRVKLAGFRKFRHIFPGH